MQLIERMRKITGRVCPILAVVAALVAPFHEAFAGGCEDRLQSKILQQTYFFDYERLETKTEGELRALLVGLEKLKNASVGRLQAMREKVHAILTNGSMNMEDLTATQNLEEEHRGILRYTEAVQRAVKRAGKPLAPPPFPIFDILVSDKTPNQVITEIMAKLEHLPGGKSRQILRYFPAAREDLVREYGTDLHGRELDDGSAWDEHGLEATLRERDLKAEDGFYAVDSELAAHMGNFENGEVIPYSMINDFVRGTRALVIYDADQLEDFGVDFYLFLNPKQKRKAVHAIIRPRQ